MYVVWEPINKTQIKELANYFDLMMVGQERVKVPCKKCGEKVMTVRHRLNDYLKGRKVHKCPSSPKPA